MRILVQPFDARGLYHDAVLALDEFAAEREGIALFHSQIERVIDEWLPGRRIRAIRIELCAAGDQRRAVRDVA